VSGRPPGRPGRPFDTVCSALSTDQRRRSAGKKAEGPAGRPDGSHRLVPWPVGPTSGRTDRSFLTSIITTVAVAALNGIAVMRAYFRLFTGARHVSTVSLQIVPRERLAVLSLAALILGGGLFPQPGIASRHRAAAAILDLRRAQRPEPIGPDARDRDANGSPTERPTTRRRGRAGLISGPLTGPVIDR